MKCWRLDPEAEPASLGLDPKKIDAVVATFNEAVTAGDMFHGGQMVVYRAGKRVLDIGGGLARVRTAIPVEPDSLFVIYSSTKAVAALAMLILYERRRFHYDEPVTKYWPSFASVVPEKSAVTIRHIMGHRGGFPLGPEWLTPDYWGDRDAIRRAMEEIPLRYTPGERNAYHAQNFGHMLNELIERIDGRDCGRFAKEEIFEPLGIEDFYLGIPEDPALEERVAWCYNHLAERLSSHSTGVVGENVERDGAAAQELAASGETFPPNPDRPDEIPEHRHPFNRPATHRAVLPASGGIATARALAKFYAPLALDEHPLVTQDGLRQTTTPTNRHKEVDAVIGFPIRWGTGWHMGFYGQGSTMRTFGHGGAGGQIGYADPETGLAVGFVCNGQLKPEFLLWRYGLQSRIFEACRD